MKTFKEFKKQQKIIKKYTKKKVKEGKSKEIAFKNFYKSIGYNGNPEDHDLD